MHMKLIEKVANENSSTFNKRHGPSQHKELRIRLSNHQGGRQKNKMYIKLLAIKKKKASPHRAFHRDLK